MSTSKKNTEIEKFNDDWGQTHETICDELGYDKDGSDDLLMSDYFWVTKSELWFPKNADFSKEEEKIKDFLRYEQK
jgi:hypothetical protein